LHLILIYNLHVLDLRHVELALHFIRKSRQGRQKAKRRKLENRE
jgi:hypothetical protein